MGCWLMASSRGDSFVGDAALQFFVGVFIRLNSADVVASGSSSDWILLLFSRSAEADFVMDSKNFGLASES